MKTRAFLLSTILLAPALALASSVTTVELNSQVASDFPANSGLPAHYTQVAYTALPGCSNANNLPAANHALNSDVIKDDVAQPIHFCGNVSALHLGTKDGHKQVLPYSGDASCSADSLNSQLANISGTKATLTVTLDGQASHCNLTA